MSNVSVSQSCSFTSSSWNSLEKCTTTYSEQLIYIPYVNFFTLPSHLSLQIASWHLLKCSTITLVHPDFANNRASNLFPCVPTIIPGCSLSHTLLICGHQISRSPAPQLETVHFCRVKWLFPNHPKRGQDAT